MAALPDTEMQDLTALPSGITSTVGFPAFDTADTTQVADGSAYKATAAQLAEYIRDTIGTALAEGTGVTVTVSDAGDTITIATSITQYTDEMARDALAAALVAGTNVTITPNDGAGTITIAASGSGGGATELDGLSDVTITSAASGNILRHNGTAFVNLAPTQAHIAPAVVALTDGATVALDASAGRTFRVTLGGNRTLAITNPTDGQVIELEIIQDGTGSRTLTLPASVRFSTTAPDSLYVLSTTAGKRDYLTLKYNSAATKWDAVGFLAGF